MRATVYRRVVAHQRHRRGRVDGYRVGMFAGRRVALIGVGASVVWFFCVLVFWAMQPMTDSVPVGVDYTLKVPAFVSVSVDCRSLFDSASRDDVPLPALKAQPPKTPALAFQREPCAIVHQQARIVFLLDTAAFAAVAAGFAWLTLRRRRSASVGQFNSDPGLSLSRQV